MKNDSFVFTGPKDAIKECNRYINITQFGLFILNTQDKIKHLIKYKYLQYDFGSADCCAPTAENPRKMYIIANVFIFLD